MLTLFFDEETGAGERTQKKGGEMKDDRSAREKVHTSTISTNNLPLPMIARFFARIGRSLIIEFIPKSDSQAQRLLASREDIFPSYTREGFEKAFADDFHIRDRQDIAESERTLYLMERK